VLELQLKRRYSTRVLNSGRPSEERDVRGSSYAQGTIYISFHCANVVNAKFCSLGTTRTAIMDATTCQYDCSYLAMDFLLLLVVLESPGYLLLPPSAKVQLSELQLPPHKDETDFDACTVCLPDFSTFIIILLCLGFGSLCSPVLLRNTLRPWSWGQIRLQPCIETRVVFRFQRCAFFTQTLRHWPAQKAMGGFKRLLCLDLSAN
jgi:hypothetical protein